VKNELLSGLDLGASFTNVPGGTAHWTFTDATGNYNDASGTADIVLSKANATVDVHGYSGTYDGSPHSATGSAKGVKNELLSGLDLGASFTNVPGGTAHWTFSGGTNYSDQAGDVSISLSRASSSVTVTCPATPVTYTGSPFTVCSAKATGVGGLEQSLSVDYTDNVNAGTAHAGASFAGDLNHDGSNGTGSFTIAKASSSTIVTCSPSSVTYNGYAQTPCSANVTGAGGLSQALTVNYLNNTMAGTANAGANFGGDANHLGSNDSKTFSITQKALTIKAKDRSKTLGESVVFTGQEFVATGLVGSDAVNAVTLSSAGSGVGAAVGTYPIVPSNAVGAGLANYSITYANGALTVGYGVCALYDQTKAVKRNATVPVKFYLCTASGQDVSSAAIVVTATQLTPTAGSAMAEVEDSGNANPDNNFRFDPSLGPSGGYIFNLSTKGVPAAMWNLSFSVGGASFGTYNLGFGVK